MADTRSTGRQLYRKPRHPYYVVAPDYRSNSAGIRVMHQLCDALRQSGEDAWIVSNKTNPRLDTPVLSAETRSWHHRQGLVPIAVYPEVVGDNPLDCQVVTRYILNFPGLLGAQPAYSDDDIFFVHAPKLLDSVPNPSGILFLPSTDTTVFHNLDNPQDASRDTECIYFGRYADGPDDYAELTARCTVITSSWPATPEEMAQLLRRSKFLYCFENTALITEARLCGCPVVILPSPFFSEDRCFTALDASEPGIALSLDSEATAEARRTVGAFDPRLLVSQEEAFWQGVDQLIEISQARANATTPVPWLGNTRADPLAERYTLWRSRRTPQEIDGQIMAERMVKKWRMRPRFALGVMVDADNAGALADTIDALARQWYPEWQLVVLARGLKAPPELAGIAQIHWLELAEGEPGFADLARACDADFYARLPAGTVLDDHALQVLADYANAEPARLAFYLDDDFATPAGPSPRFKPDFNPELLYSNDYIGPACFIRREAIAAFADTAEAAAAPFDLLLRLFEQTGAASIGHIADPLVHLPGEVQNGAAEETALHAHFERTGRAATIEAGWFPDTRRIAFACSREPLVSLIVLSSDQPGYLRHGLATLLETADWPKLELVVVDHASRDPDMRKLLDEIADGRLGIPAQVLREDGAFAPAAFRNRAAQAAGGEYLLFIDDDLEFSQPGWLRRMLGHALAGGAAVLAPRLVANGEIPTIVATGQILGLGGLAGSISSGSLLEPGYLLRPQLDQEVSAVAGQCMLIRRDAFDRMEGFDEQAVPLALPALDFCLRARARGERIVWLASVDVIHHGGVTARRTTATPAAQAAWLAQRAEEKERVLERHLPALAADPFYNRHLSLIEPFAPDIHAEIDWDTRFRDRPRILGIPLTSGAGEYRMTAPFRALGKAGLAQCCIVHPIDHTRQRVLTPIELARAAPDSVMLQNVIEDVQIASLTDLTRHNPGVLKILTLDDRLGELPREHPLHAHHRLQGKAQLRRSLAQCDRLIVSTEPLADYCRDMIGDIRLVPNRLEREQWCTLQPVVNESPRPRIGWVGAMQHQGDLRLIEPVVQALAGEVDWIFMGMCPDFLRPYAKEVHPFVSITEYPRKMASLALDLALAPLEVHPFNEAKSNLRLLEYGALAWPVICSDIHPYRTGNPPVTRLPNLPDAWIAAIRERIGERDALRREGHLLRHWVHDNYILEDGLEGWLDALLPAAGKSASSS